MEEKEKLFNMAKEMHPTWSSEKQWAYVSIVITAEKVIKDKPTNLNMSENLMREILTQAKSWLMQEFPNSFTEYEALINEMEQQIPDIIN